LLGIEAADIYAAHIGKPDRFDVRMTQSRRARAARLRVGLVPEETDNEWNVAYLKEVASRIARDRNPGIAVLLVFDGPGGWTPRWAIEPESSGLGSERPGSLSRLGASNNFELHSYPHAVPEAPPAVQDRLDTTLDRREGGTVNLTDHEEHLLRALSGRPEVTEKLYRLDPDLFARLIETDVSARDVVAIAHRRAVVDLFRRLLDDPEFFSDAAEPFDGKKEKVWQNLLEANPWILGVSLAGQLLTSWDENKLEQTVAGFSIKDPGKRVDALLSTNGQIRAMVFAEIKHHETELLSEEYKTGCWAPSAEVSGGVVQIQRTVHIATRQIGDRLAAKDSAGADTGEYIYLVRPREFLIVGNLEQLRGPHGDHQAKYESFELYRRNLYEPEIITFDELLVRAEWHVERLEPR